MALALLGLTAEALAGLSADGQFAAVRKAWLAQALENHPDKGGDPATFLSIRAAFDALRAAHAAGAPPLAEVGATAGTNANGSIRSQEFYAAAAGEPVPGYKVMRAPSGQSKCVKTGELIAKNEIRVGSLEEVSGSYGRWSKLHAWRVPVSIFLACPREGADLAAFGAALAELEGVTLVGFAGLDEEAKAALCAHVAAKANHAKYVDAKTQVEEAPTPTTGVVKKRAFATATEQALPRPNIDGVAPNQLAGVSCVLTGVFDVSGGVGLARGKDGTKKWLESHSAKVVGSISKKTTYLVVGSLPGASKLGKALASGATLVTPETLAAGLRAGDVPAAIAGAPPIDVETLELSEGFANNSKPLELKQPFVKRLKM